MNSLDKILPTIISARKLSQKVVLVTGVFDIIHQEHKVFLNKAKAVGDLLVVGIETDARVEQMKGKGRPKNSQDVRMTNLLKLGIANTAFLLPQKFSTPTQHLKLISKIKPTILAVSSHSSFQKEKQQIMNRVGGKLQVVHQHNPQVSTSKTLKTNDHI